MNTRNANGNLKVVKYEVKESNHEDEDDRGVIPVDRDDSSDDEPRPSKRRRQSYVAGTPKASGLIKKLYRGKNVGKLSKLLDVPVDVFCEISIHLEPLDLLRLARSTRGLNQMLMSRESKPIWRAARGYYPGLPDCPPDLSEPEYARLIFERDCHACLAPRAMKVDWVMRSRLCHRCRSSYILKGTQLMKAIPDLTEQLLECIPCRNNQWAGARGRHRRLEYFYSRRIQAVVAKYRATVPRNLTEDQAQPLREEFFKQHKELIGVITTHAANVVAWLASDRRTKSAEGSEAASRRNTEIRSKLMDLGYNEVDFPSTWEPVWHQITNQPRDLTPRIWIAVRPRLEECIRTVKLRREETVRNARKASRRSELGMYSSSMRAPRGDRGHIPLQDLLTLPTVEAMITKDDFGRPITQEMWNAAKEQIEKEMEQHTEQARQGLINLIVASRQAVTSETGPDGSRKSVALPLVGTALLVSPCTFFQCKHCKRLQRYPQILNHTHGWSSQWNLNDFIFSNAVTAVAEVIASSMDLAKVDSPLLQSYQCLRCDDNISNPLDWQSLVTHFHAEQAWYEATTVAQAKFPTVTFYNDHDISDHSESGPPLATILTMEETRAQNTKVSDFNRGSSIYGCRFCPRDNTKTRGEVAIHLKRRHLIDSPDPDDIRSAYP